VLWSREGVVYRQTPRDNDAVNQCWMCDYGRLNFKFINDPQRITAPSVKSAVYGERVNLTWLEATRQITGKLKAAGNIAGIASGRATTEELFLFKKLVGDLVDIVAHTGEADGKLLQADRNPNTAGAKLTGCATGKLPEILEGIKAGKIKTLIVLGEDLDEELAKKLELLVVIDTLPTKVTEHAHYVLPGATFAEKRGTFINGKNRLQRFQAAIPPVGIARPEWQTLTALLGANYAAIEDVFADMARTLPALAGLNLSKTGDGGVELDVGRVTSRSETTGAASGDAAYKVGAA
jgi:NADH-quinone oxidoreductase subunit G